MAIKYYDEALYNKIQSWIRDPNMRILKADETLESFRIKADKTGDSPLKLPFVDISRTSQFEILRLGRTPLSCSGTIVAAGQETIIPLNAIPISLSYKIDIYTQDYAQADIYLRELIFNLVNHNTFFKACQLFYCKFVNFFISTQTASFFNVYSSL